MLLQSHTGVIHVLPALSSAWATGSYERLRARGGFEVSAVWRRRRISRITVASGAGHEAKVQSAALAGPITVDREHDRKTVRYQHDGDVLRFATEPGHVYTIRSGA